MRFRIKSPYQPAGDQPQAIAGLTNGIQRGLPRQTLLGVTGSGKTFTIANIIANVERPTLVIAHNKTLAAQLCSEFRAFFPDNAVAYFVSYYDYYQPEAYLPTTDTYIEKEAMINDEIDRLRHAATQALLSRRDVIVVASVSCIYGLGSPVEYQREVLHIRKESEESKGSDGSEDKEGLGRNELLRRLIRMQFERTTADLTRGHFRVRGDVIEIMPTHEERLYRLIINDGKIGQILALDSVTRRELEDLSDVWIFPAKHYVISPKNKDAALKAVRSELDTRLKELSRAGRLLEAERLDRRTRYDLEMIREVGYCHGIENYSRYFDGRSVGEPPFTLLDYFPKDFLTVIDESHVTVPQIGGMYNGDRARKDTLIEHGFRLPSARDNRPLTLKEFESRVGQVVFTSATPGRYEIEQSQKIGSPIVEQIIRPTGLVDPEVEVRPITGAKSQVDDLMEEITIRVLKQERVLVTTLTKKMAEDLTEFLKERKIKVQYLHSDVETIERIRILSEFRQGVYDVLIGVNLLREGLDLPEVTLVAILDADKEGFLRSEISIIQTIGRAARNVSGRVILYADELTGSIKRAIQETERRRLLQLAHNAKYKITPRTVQKEVIDIRGQIGFGEKNRPDSSDEARRVLRIELTAEPHELKKVMAEKEAEMKEAAQNLDFELAALLRDELSVLKQELIEEKTRKQKKYGR